MRMRLKETQNAQNNGLIRAFIFFLKHRFIKVVT